MSGHSRTEFTAMIGIDWADTKHDICIQPADSDEREFQCIAHNPKQIERWALSMLERFGAPIAVALEIANAEPRTSANNYRDSGAGCWASRTSRSSVPG